MTSMVRQMQPTAEGIPLEIYCFTTATAWAEYERIQGDSFTNAMLVIATLIMLYAGLSLAKLDSKPLARLLDGHATLVVENGRFLQHRMRRVRLTEDDILESARDSQGLEKVEQIKFAIVERNGKISIIPR